MNARFFLFFKFSAVFLLIAVFIFSNFVSFLPEVLRNNKLAENLKILEARAAVKTLYFHQDVSPLAGNWIMFDGVVPNATSNTTSISQSPSAANHTIIKPGVISTTTGTPGTTPNGFGWFSDATMNGTFASGAWTFRVRKTDNRSSIVGHPVFQVFRVPQNTSLTSAVRLFSFDATATDWWAGNTASITYTSTTVGPFALTNEYLFIEVWDHETTVNAGKRLNLIVEGSELADTNRTKVTTPDFAIPLTLVISQTAGFKVAAKNSGAVDQYAHDAACTGAVSCSAFTLAASGGTVNVTSIKITESGTATANTELSDLNLYYDTDGNWSDAGVETLFGTAAVFAADQTATVSGTLAISAGATAYIYVRYDLANAGVYPQGGATVNFQIAAAADVVSDATESGSGTLAGTQTVLPTADSVTYAASPDGGRSGDTATISGKGFGAPSLDADQQDCVTATVGSKGCVRFIAGGNATVLGSDISTWNNTTITFTVNSGIATFGGTSAMEVVAAAQSTAVDLNYYIYPNITSITTPSVADAARESESITLNGNHFDAAVNQGTVNFTGGFGSVSASISSWGDTAVTATAPTAIADNIYLGDITLTRAAATGSKTDLAYGANTFRILPKIASTGPINLKGGRGDTGVSITGDHLCQSGICPTSFSAANSVNFTGGSVTTGASTWTDTFIPSIIIPATAIDGNLNITSNTSYTSNNLTYDIKFVPTVSDIGRLPANAATGQLFNLTLTGSAFADASDSPADIQIDSEWQLDQEGTFVTPEWTESLSSANTTITVNNTNGIFAGLDAGQTQLDCNTAYSWRFRYKDNGGVASQEWSNWSTIWTFTIGSCNTLTVSTAGAQVASIIRNTTNNYLGGTFTFITSVSAATVTSIKISDIGTIVANNNLNNVKLFGDSGGAITGVYEPGLDTQIGATQITFSATEDTTFSGLSLSVSTTAIYIYAVVDIDLDPVVGQTIEIQISNPSTDIIVTGASNSDTLAKAIAGATIVANPYQSTGTLESAVFDTGAVNGASFNSVSWDGLVNGGAVQFQLATSNSSTGPWTFYGDAGLGSGCLNTDYYNLTGVIGLNNAKSLLSCAVNLNNRRYFKYRIRLCSASNCVSQTANTPQVNEINVNWSP